MNQRGKKSLDHQDSHAMVEHRVLEVRGLDFAGFRSMW
jgi:hypothetical protein